MTFFLGVYSPVRTKFRYNNFPVDTHKYIYVCVYFSLSLSLS